MASTRSHTNVPAAVWYTLAAALVISLLVVGVSLFYMPGIDEPVPAAAAAAH